MGLEGFSGNESILYHLHSPCRVTEVGEFEPIERDEWVPDAPRAPALRARMGLEPEGDAISGRRLLMWNDDVEISLCRPDDGDGLLLPQRRGRRGDLRPRGLGHARDDLRRRARTARTTTSSSRAARPTASAPRAPQRYLVFESPGLIEIPRRYRNDYGQLLEHAPFYHRDIHPPTELQTHRDRGELRRQGARPRRLPDLRARLPPVRRRRLGRLRLPVDVQHPRLRADHRAHPHAAALAPDLRGPQLRDLLVLPAQARLRPAGDPDPVPPLEPELRGDDLLRLRATSPRARASTSAR